MKKMNNYEAPVAEVIEMTMPVVLMGSNDGTGDPGNGNPWGGGGFGS